MVIAAAVEASYDCAARANNEDVMVKYEVGQVVYAHREDWFDDECFILLADPQSLAPGYVYNGELALFALLAHSTIVTTIVVDVGKDWIDIRGKIPRPVDQMDWCVQEDDRLRCISDNGGLLHDLDEKVDGRCTLFGLVEDGEPAR